MNCSNTISTLLLGNDLDYILFKLAIHFAEQGLNTWFISIAAFEKIPENIEQPCKEVLQLITFIYLKDYLDLIKHLNGIHKWKHTPNIIILKDFERYCRLDDAEYNSVRTAFLSATLLDSVKFLARKKDCTSFLLVCCSNFDRKTVDDKLKILYDMYFNNFLLKKNFENDEKFINVIEKQFLTNKTADK